MPPYSAIAVALLIAVAGCAQPDPFAVAHAVSQGQARAMIGKEYVITAPLLVCRDQSDVYDFRYLGPIKHAPLKPVINPRCDDVGAGRFRVVDAATAWNDPRTILHIAGPGIDGYIPYESFLPTPYKEAGAYFGTR